MTRSTAEILYEQPIPAIHLLWQTKFYALINPTHPGRFKKNVAEILMLHDHNSLRQFVIFLTFIANAFAGFFLKIRSISCCVNPFC